MKEGLEGMRQLLRFEDGATAVEYAIMAGFIIAVIAAAVGNLGHAVKGLFKADS